MLAGLVACEVFVMFYRKQGDLGALTAELTRRKAQLADLESGKNWLPMEREAAVRRRVAELELMIEKGDNQKRLG